MTNRSTLRALRDFWRSFGKLPLYDTGFGDAIAGCGAHRMDEEPETADALTAMAYLKGYADAARLACTYMEPSWQIANLLGIAAGTFLAKLQDDEFTVLQAERLCHTYTVELAELCRKKADPPVPARGGCMTVATFNEGWREGYEDEKRGRPSRFMTSGGEVFTAIGLIERVETKMANYARGYVGGYVAKSDCPPTGPEPVTLGTLVRQNREASDPMAPRRRRRGRRHGRARSGGRTALPARDRCARTSAALRDACRPSPGSCPRRAEEYPMKTLSKADQAAVDAGREYLAHWLREAHKHGGIVYDIPKVSRSGMSRQIVLARVVPAERTGKKTHGGFWEEKPAHVQRLFPSVPESFYKPGVSGGAALDAVAKDWGYSFKSHTFVVGGCGMDMTFALVDRLAYLAGLTKPEFPRGFANECRRESF